VTYITPWDNPGYDLKVYDYIDDNFYAQGSNTTSINDLLRLSYSCPKVVVNYDSKTVTCQINKTGEDGELYFTAASGVPGQHQCYIDIYFYFNDLCVGRYCITGRYEIHDDQGVQ
jgi:hypothetical protein